ncbi:MAG TPA: polymer-forming cytoskeletal protein [Thermoanaerobaculia bacterium]|jgi:cytoskeletal protein CcmA (bactofilin family)|nr:polymer-forming cytoskeletal protein [Thermoanaerobaculia bacterium]
MWKRPDEQAVPVPIANAEPRSGTPSPSPPPPRVATGGSPARLGPSLTFEGKLSGEEDLFVEGRFRGEIQVPAHQVTIGADGHVEGEVRASAIVVEGEVRGNLTASQQVLVRASGQVHGDIRAPRVALDQGCRFKGAIDMEPTGNSKGAADLPERRDQRRDREREREREGARPVVPVSTPAAS